jgi:hypothetical protein
VGSLINKVLPSLITSISLVLFLALVGRRTLNKALALVKKEGGWDALFSGPRRQAKTETASLTGQKGTAAPGGTFAAPGSNSGRSRRCALEAPAPC